MKTPKSYDVEEIMNRVNSQIFYFKSLRGNNFYDEQRKPSLKPNILPDDEELAELAYISLGLSEQKFLPSNKYGPKL